MKEFFTTQMTSPPPISFLWFSVMILVLIVLAILSFRYADRPRFRQSFKYIQWFQLICLYAWYITFAIPLSNSLPLYHCRLAMLALLLLPDRLASKQYFALLGASGASFAIVYPVFDPYNFPHITSFSFLIGHYALWVNSLVYLLNQYKASRLTSRGIIVYTLLMNACLLLVNQLTGGNYGLMKTTPILNSHNLLLNYTAVSLVLTLALLLLNSVIKKRKEKIPS